MKRLLKIITGASAASILACSALAQFHPYPGIDRPVFTDERMPAPRRMDRLNGAVKASDLLGMTVRNFQGIRIGKVEELAVDVESGRVIQVILSIGGFMRNRGALIAVPPGALHQDVAQNGLRLDADNERLRRAPRFEEARWADYSDYAHVSEVYRLYGEEPAFIFVRRGEVGPDGQRRAEGAPGTVAVRRADGTWERDRIVGGSQAMIPEARLGQVRQASKLMGAPVRNLQDERLGKVENLLVDLPSGRVVAVVISSGGYIGMRDELSAVPLAAFRFTPARPGFQLSRDGFQLDTSRETLRSAPHFQARQWPDFAEPAYVGGVYRAYRVEPYFTAETTREPDNTARNVRDREVRTVTPLDQGNNRADLATTAQIRKEILAVKTMSVNARNVKIITYLGQVTLRGPVNTAEEKRQIGEIADRVARPGNVDNQLEVQFTTRSSN